MSELSKETVGPQLGMVMLERVGLLGLGLSAFVTLPLENLEFSGSSSDPSVTNNGS